jgi:hypothetical protein
MRLVLSVAAIGCVALSDALSLSSALSPSVRPALHSFAKRNLFMQAAEEEVEEMTEEEYMAELAAQQQVEETGEDLSEEAARVKRGMTSATGVEFAPWMKVDAEAIAKAKKEREERKRRSQAAGAVDSIQIDPQAAEMNAASGLKAKTLSEEEVELKWDTGDETGNAGFIVQRRRGGQEAFENLASFETFAPLRTKGPQGGTYIYLDDTAGVGTWVYRIIDCDTKGVKSGICQKLVEIESGAEQTQTLVIGGAIAGLALVLVAAGIFADPIQTTDMGSKMF